MKSESKLPVRNYVGYAMGDMAGVLTFGTIGAFLQMFYTDILHISLASITVLMMVARIWDAVNDPMCGALIDSRKPTKYGRFRPYVLYFSVPLALAFIATFYKVPGLSEKGYLIYAYITYILYCMMYTAVNIPYGSMAFVIGITDKQYYIAWKDSFGFINKESAELLPVSEDSFRTGLITLNGKTAGTSPITVRKEPSAKAKSIGEWKPGTPVAVLYDKGEFYFVEGKGLRGWVHQKYLKLEGEENDGQKVDEGE